MDRREAMALSGLGSYYIQGGMLDSAPPQTQPSFHGSQGFHYFSSPNSPFVPNPNQGGGSTGFVSPPLPVETSQVDTSTPVALPPSGESSVKRRRGRPRKYGQDGSVSLALSPSVSSSSMSPNSNKRGRGRPLGSGKKQRLSSIGGLMMPLLSGMSLTPHVIVVSVGEDIASKVMSFSQQSPRAICVLSASGAVSTATILQPSSHGAIKYEGRFEILSLSTSYPNATGNEYSNRTVNLGVSLASPDGRVIGGGLGGPLIAASSVQVIVGSFSWALPKGKIKNNRNEDAQYTDALDDNTAATSPHVPQQSQNLVQAPVGMWSRGSRSMDMHHAHMDIDLMRG